MTVEEVLRQSGMTDEQIKALDAKVLGGFTQVLSTAAQTQEQARKDKEAAELAQRAQQQLYDTEIAPKLDQWGNEASDLKAQIAFYKTQAEEAKKNGFTPKDAPGYTPPVQDPATGRFVPGANPVPGSPAYLTPQEGIRAVSNVTWVMSEHQRLFGQPLPDEFETLMNESMAQRMQFRDYANKKYGFDAKKAEIAAAAKQKERDGIVKETEDRIRKEFAERGGNNPMVRQGVTSDFSKVKAAQAAGTRKDPLTMNPEQRRAQTRQFIHEEIAKNEAGGPVN